jgi:nucleoid-associated protein YgaU
MDTLKNKNYESYDYLSRYAHVPYYFDTVKQREVYGIGSNLSKDTQYVSHKLVQEDTLHSLALQYYNNPTYWWVIAYFNDIQDAFRPLLDQLNIIRIPNIAGITFGRIN